MGIETVVNKTKQKIAIAGLSGILGLGSLVLGPETAYAQQKSKSPGKIIYLPCTQEQKKSMEKQENNDNLLPTAALDILGIVGMLNNNPNAQTLGAMASKQAERQYGKEVAREGRSEVNIDQNQPEYFPYPGCGWVNPDDPKDLSVRKSLGIALTAKYYNDFNKDGIADIAEFGDIKPTFYDDEKSMTIALYNPTKQKISDKKIEWSLYYLPTGEKVYENSWESGEKYGTVFLNGKEDWIKYLANKGYGNYISVFTSDGITEVSKFEILPASQRAEKKQ